MSVGLAWKSAAKSNEKLVNEKYATLFLSWMPFTWKEQFHTQQKWVLGLKNIKQLSLIIFYLQKEIYNNKYIQLSLCPC